MSESTPPSVRGRPWPSTQKYYSCPRKQPKNRGGGGGFFRRRRGGADLSERCHVSATRLAGCAVCTRACVILERITRTSPWKVEGHRSRSLLPRRRLRPPLCQLSKDDTSYAVVSCDAVILHGERSEDRHAKTDATPFANSSKLGWGSFLPSFLRLDFHLWEDEREGNEQKHVHVRASGAQLISRCSRRRSSSRGRSAIINISLARSPTQISRGVGPRR